MTATDTNQSSITRPTPALASAVAVTSVYASGVGFLFWSRLGLIFVTLSPGWGEIFSQQPNTGA